MAGPRIALLAAAMALALAGCGGGAVEPAVQPVPAAPGVDPQSLVGSWGLASYHKDEDRLRTEKEAKGQCNRPYVIARGPGGGVMVHLADQKEPQELVIKGRGSKNYLGPAGDAGGVDDREVTNLGPNGFTMIWVDPDNAHRYGTMVYVRCPSK